MLLDITPQVSTDDIWFWRDKIGRSECRTGLSGDVMKIAIINQPWSHVLPPVRSADSIALWTDEVAHRLVKQDCWVAFYSRVTRGEPRVVSHGESCTDG